MKAQPKHHSTYAPYVVIPDLLPEQQTPLNEWLKNQTREVVEHENENKHNCCYYSDYSRWYDAWIKGEEAENDD
jgi:hypothetical protein